LTFMIKINTISLYHPAAAKSLAIRGIVLRHNILAYQIYSDSL